ncbi:MAG: neutral amino acid transporter [Vezdaea aestivalis]|nr:MAG: neutral amino acid transporter [Vezdaea aestivalis]
MSFPLSGSPRASMSSKPVPISRSSSLSRGRGTDAASQAAQTRAESTARLASPVPTHSFANTPIRQVPLQHSQAEASRTGGQEPLAGASAQSASSGPGQSAIATAFQHSSSQNHSRSQDRSPRTLSPRRFETPPLRAFSPPPASEAVRDSHPATTYGSFDVRSFSGTPTAGATDNADLDIVKKHLVQPDDSADVSESDVRGRSFSRALSRQSSQQPVVVGMDADEFSSLRLQGGDMTREVYRWAEEMDEQGRPRQQRSKSFFIPRPDPVSDTLDINSIKVPGGFRRDYLRRAAASPSPSGAGEPTNDQAPREGFRLFTNSFVEFLSLYGHFAGENLDEDDEDLAPGEYFGSGESPNDSGNETANESTALLSRPGTGRRRRTRRAKPIQGENSNSYTFFVLLKSFVGTGVLFLPRAFLNGGMLFSNVVLLAISMLCFYCFILLVNTRKVVPHAFGEMGGIIYNKWLRGIILFSLVISQIGFASAYIVFISQNIQAFVESVTDCKQHWDIGVFILAQLPIFIPLSWIRAIEKLSLAAMIADALIILGLIYLYYYNIYTIGYNRGMNDIKAFNPNGWTVFIGTAVFTFEGVGLIIPIQEGMKRPQSFTPLLAITMVLVTVIYLTMGTLAYGAFGSKTETVILLNLPGDSKAVQGVQFVYSLAILLSTPLQLFPAVKILENELFARSGKFNRFIKWEKNTFRSFLVILCSAIAYGGAGNLDKFVAVVGSFACIPLVYIYPPMLHFKSAAKSKLAKAGDILIIVVGFYLMMYTSYVTLQGWYKGGRQEKTPSFCDLRRQRGSL